MATVEERLASVETYMEHVATRADVAEIKVAMTEMKEELMTQLTWRMFGMIVGMFVAVSSVAAVAIAVSQTVLIDKTMCR